MIQKEESQGERHMGSACPTPRTTFWENQWEESWAAGTNSYASMAHTS